MKTLVFLCLAVATVMAVEKYPDQWDNYPIDDVLKNDRILVVYIKCSLQDTPCSNKEAERLRQYLPEAIRTGCERCTDKQKELARYVIRFLREHKPQEWASIVSKYDPTGELRAKYEHFLKA
ncbi:hypothetical protein R5R35_009436 [Gryllus longicercus]|uniref:Chemosensory protein n=1 Tax=Gryllus longicercus TaxID=2509291 RepID=A0AAN9Z9E8_9ORTH